MANTRARAAVAQGKRRRAAGAASHGLRVPQPREDDLTTRIYDTGRAPERVFLLAVDSAASESPWSAEDSIAELASLAQTAGAEVVGTAIQRLRGPDPVTYFGKGRIHEVEAECDQLGATLVIVDDELTPAQQRNLEETVHRTVLDRTALILDIFAQHARTREGQLQVELAQYVYRLPRLAGNRANLSRQGGGSRGATGGAGGAIGARGPGETKLEVDRRRVRTRIAMLRHDLEEVREQRALQRSHRLAQDLPVVAVVGYTNAGKSTLFNALTSAEVLVENKLFATLDPTTRQIILPSHQALLLTDTVGFIQKLPTTLVAAFRATLEVVNEADVLLEVVDITHENAVEQSDTVQQVLRDLDAADKPRVTALNKIDLLPDPAVVDRSVFPNAVPVSAVTRAGFAELQETLGRVISATMEPVTVEIPFARGELVERFHRRGRVTAEEHLPTGTLIHGLLPRSLREVYRPFARAAGTRAP